MNATHEPKLTSTDLKGRPALPPSRSRRFEPRGERASRRPSGSVPAAPAPLRPFRRPRPERALAERLIAEYTPVVHMIVAGFLRRLPRNVLREDLVAAGLSGLWDAIRKNPGGPGPSFEWYARVRIRGAILDELRAQDWLPRRARALAEKSAKSEHQVPVPSVVRLDDVSEWEQNRCLADYANGEAACDQKAAEEVLDRAVEQLPDRERHIVRAHYFRGARFKDLGSELGVSEPRVSQLHTRALGRLRGLMEPAA